MLTNVIKINSISYHIYEVPPPPSSCYRVSSERKLSRNFAKNFFHISPFFCEISHFFLNKCKFTEKVEFLFSRNSPLDKTNYDVNNYIYLHNYLCIKIKSIYIQSVLYSIIIFPSFNARIRKKYSKKLHANL